jgi:hypothetical protein
MVIIRKEIEDLKSIFGIPTIPTHASSVLVTID